jgi:alpha-amylase
MHKRDMWIMIDVVPNHVAPVGMDFSGIIPFNKAEHYHAKCDVNDDSDQWHQEHCRLLDLPDLDHDANP